MSSETDDTLSGSEAAVITDAARTESELADRVETLNERVDDLEAGVEAGTDDSTKRMTIIATKGTLDMAYPPLILASTAAAFGWEVTVFHTFWGLEILHEERSKELQLSSVGNPNTPLPNALAALPGMDRLTTTMMRRSIDDVGTPTIDELVDTCLEMGADLQACQMTADMMDYDEDAFYDGVTTGVGAASALSEMAEADVQLLV
ncbi:DsrE/DsrF/DrsH-like family protein [Halobaculum sp. CBA1158]|uniref:DsrE/DsrF/DrsH-like family protein n=1 Tax=Halobaculum sp. CBA1158 TaxID=2904243 RepID=UPI001F3ED2E4|nr:DsrE/DsrF/DrsH-like family protein [Halobaculum sp. CBA1158]UIP00520.1 DsrE/DsrF/DrsH-like family protein [Halobaculum sp. CBA1158]